MPIGAIRSAIAPYALLQGFGGSLGANAALPDASPPPELWVASSSQSCRIPYSSSGVLYSSGAAIPARRGCPRRDSRISFDTLVLHRREPNIGAPRNAAAGMTE